MSDDGYVRTFNQYLRSGLVLVCSGIFSLASLARRYASISHSAEQGIVFFPKMESDGSSTPFLVARPDWSDVDSGIFSTHAQDFI